MLRSRVRKTGRRMLSMTLHQRTTLYLIAMKSPCCCCAIINRYVRRPALVQKEPQKKRCCCVIDRCRAEGLKQREHTLCGCSKNARMWNACNGNAVLFLCCIQITKLFYHHPVFEW